MEALSGLKTSSGSSGGAATFMIGSPIAPVTPETPVTDFGGGTSEEDGRGGVGVKGVGWW